MEEPGATPPNCIRAQAVPSDKGAPLEGEVAVVSEAEVAPVPHHHSRFSCSPRTHHGPGVRVDLSEPPCRGSASCIIKIAKGLDAGLLIKLLDVTVKNWIQCKCLPIETG